MTLPDEPDASSWQHTGALGSRRLQNHFLPLRTSVATPGEVAATEQALAVLLPQVQNDGSAICAALAQAGLTVRLMIDLGRSAGGLSRLARVHLAPDEVLAPPPWGLVSWRHGAALKYGWWLPAGVHIEPEKGALADQARGAIWLPVLQRTEPWLEVAGLMGEVSRHDVISADVARHAAEFLAWGRRTLGPLGRALPTMEKLPGALNTQLTWQPAGDRILANQITGKDMEHSRARSYYSSLSTTKAARQYTRAVSSPPSQASLVSADGEEGTIAMPAFAMSASTQQNRKPGIETVKALLELQPARIDRRRDLVEEHKALVIRLWLALALSTAARGVTNWVPGPPLVEPRTGGLLVLDKDFRQANGDSFGTMLSRARLVFLHPAVRALLARYLGHLRQLVTRQDVESRSRLLIEEHVAALDAGRVVPFLILRRHADGRQLNAQEAAPSWITDELADLEHVPRNFARHTLRSALIGHVPQAAIDALLGHADSGTEPWEAGSALDPAGYRALLQVIFEAHFADIADFRNDA